MNVLVLGGIIIDKYYLINDYPKCGTDTFINEAFKVPGGCSLNAAVTLKNLGCSPYVFSKIGDDVDGKQIQEYLNNKKMDTRFIHRVKASSDYCLVFVDKSGERTFFTYDKLDRNISSELMDEMLKTNFQSVYVTGYFMVNDKLDSNKLTLLKLLANKGVKILFDPGAIAGEIDMDVLKELIMIADIITPNKYEEAVISEKIGSSLKKLIKDTCYLISKDGGNELSIQYGKKTEYMKPYKSTVVDTTGAGDSFAAGVLFGFSKGYDIKNAVEIGMACGALTTTFKEPHGTFCVDDINEIIENGSVKDEKQSNGMLIRRSDR